MSKVKFAQIGNNQPIKKHNIKLKVTDYVFEYKGKDLSDAYLNYYLDKIKYTQYIDGKKNKEYYTPIIFFSISAELDKVEYIFDFALEKGLNDLNSLEINNIIDITESIIKEGTYFQGNNEFEPIYFPHKDNFYSYNPSFVVIKLAENKFIFKIQCQNIFIWFIMNFIKDKN